MISRILACFERNSRLHKPRWSTAGGLQSFLQSFALLASTDEHELLDSSPLKYPACFVHRLQIACSRLVRSFPTRTDVRLQHATILTLAPSIEGKRLYLSLDLVCQVIAIAARQLSNQHMLSLMLIAETLQPILDKELRCLEAQPHILCRARSEQSPSKGQVSLQIPSGCLLRGSI